MSFPHDQICTEFSTLLLFLSLTMSDMVIVSSAVAVWTDKYLKLVRYNEQQVICYIEGHLFNTRL